MRRSVASGLSKNAMAYAHALSKAFRVGMPTIYLVRVSNRVSAIPGGTRQSRVVPVVSDIAPRGPGYS